MAHRPWPLGAVGCGGHGRGLYRYLAVARHVPVGAGRLLRRLYDGVVHRRGLPGCAGLCPAKTAQRPYVDADGLALGIGAAVLVLLCQKIFTTRTLRRLMVIGMFFFADAGWMQYMRTHVYTQGGKPILAAFGHYAQVGFAVCAAVWAVLFFALRSREIPLWKAGRVLTAIAVTLGVVLVVLANYMPGFPSR